MKWNIITDSSCDMLPSRSMDGEVQVSCVPFIITAGNRDFVDDEALDISVMLDAMERSKDASHTSCPAPNGWINEFKKCDQCIVITISSQLSGSMNSAMIAKEIVIERYAHKKIAVLDSCSTGPELVLCVEKIIRLIGDGCDYEQVVAEARDFLAHTHVTFALSSFDNLVKKGRMSKLTGFVAHKLGMWGIGAGSEKGTIEFKGKTRGPAKALAMILEDMKAHGFRGGEVVISHCQNLAFAKTLQSSIEECWAGSRVRILPTRGLCSYYAERGGLIVGY